jgi:hypothetical protein
MRNSTAAIIEGSRLDATATELQELRHLAVAALQYLALVTMSETMSEPDRLEHHLTKRLLFAKLSFTLAATVDADERQLGPLRLLDHYGEEALNNPLPGSKKGAPLNGP